MVRNFLETWCSTLTSPLCDLKCWNYWIISGGLYIQFGIKISLLFIIAVANQTLRLLIYVVSSFQNFQNIILISFMNGTAWLKMTNTWEINMFQQDFTSINRIPHTTDLWYIGEIFIKQWIYIKGIDTTKKIN